MLKDAAEDRSCDSIYRKNRQDLSAVCRREISVHDDNCRGLCKDTLDNSKE